ncbi:PaaI family thioesterase [Gordonia sp. CPCC 206044]|uniref:PaaI family thioesterase n=1 Tax=Gordonia sp. CPCC 206044 TaxID=3140793 RepID=UPI003AF3EA03
MTVDESHETGPATPNPVTGPADIFETFAQIGYGPAHHDGAELVVELPVAPHVVNTRGGIQGGLLAAMVDIVAGQHAVEGRPAETGVVTSDMNIRFLRPISEGAARARSRVLHSGRRSVIVQVNIFGTRPEKLAVTATVDFAILTGPNGGRPGRTG